MDKTMSTTVEKEITDLINDYERRLKTVNYLLTNRKPDTTDTIIVRLETKQSCFRSIVAELKRLKIK